MQRNIDNPDKTATEQTASLWQSLRRIRSLSFTSKSESPAEWNGGGKGMVTVSEPRKSSLIFHETGKWHPASGGEIQFSNVFRWSLTVPGHVRLEHLRFGPENPVLLFDMAPDIGGMWSSVDPHLCEKDSYIANLRMNETGIFLRWIISGPKKSVSIEYRYSWNNDQSTNMP